MVINNSGNLSKDYFIAYLKLIMASTEPSLEKAKEIIFLRLFNKEANALGSISYNNLILAYKELKKD